MHTDSQPNLVKIHFRLTTFRLICDSPQYRHNIRSTKTFSQTTSECNQRPLIMRVIEKREYRRTFIFLILSRPQYIFGSTCQAYRLTQPVRLEILYAASRLMRAFENQLNLFLFLCLVCPVVFLAASGFYLHRHKGCFWWFF